MHWEIELSQSEDSAMDEILAMQKEDANNAFFRFIKDNYLDWLDQPISDERPMLSHEVFKQKVFPLLDKGKKVFVLVIDNLRFDQWRTINAVFNNYFRTESEELYFGILPTATMYARNAMFAGLMPLDIEKMYPQLWDDDDNEGNKNQHEEELLRKQMERFRRKEKVYFEKFSGIRMERRVGDALNNILENDLSVMVFNFVDMISHARTEMDMIKELASNEKAYRSLTLSWFNNSSLLELLDRKSVV